MSLFGWLKRSRAEQERRRHQWRQTWTAAVDGGDAGRMAWLRAQLPALQSADGDVEVELEMLDALDQLLRLHAECSTGTLPRIETQHRVIGSEACHFSAPASLPEDPSQPSGRVLFTPSRSLFVSGGKTSALPWHAVQHILRADRDVLLARGDGASGAHFRFNTYADAVIAAFLARWLKATRNRAV